MRLLTLFLIIVFCGRTHASVSCHEIYTKFTHSQFSMLEKTIQELGENQQIPEAIYDQYSIDDIGSAIVQRIKKQEVKHHEDFLSGSRKIDFKNDTDIILFFWSKNIDSIAKNGFLNQHETTDSVGTYNPALRITAEDNYTGLQMGQSTPAKKMRPKSAFLNIRSDIDLDSRPSNLLYHYGNIGAVMKSTTKEKSIWTIFPSLAIGEEGVSRTAPLLQKRGTFERDSIPITGRSSACYEAVIYGKLGIEDVDYFFAGEKENLNQLKALGKPIYLIKVVTRNNRVIYEKGEQL